LIETVAVTPGSVFQNLSVGVVVLDLGNHVLDINRAAVQILGLGTQELSKRPLPELLEEKPLFRDVLERGLNESPDREIELEITDPEGEKTYLVQISKIQDGDDWFSGRLLQFQDISRRKEAETRLEATRQSFRSVIDTLQDCYFEADPTGVITNANQPFARRLGLDKNEVVGKHFRHFIHRRSLRSIYVTFQKLYETQQPQRSKEYYFTRKDGSEKVADLTISPIFKGDQVVGSWGIIRDITDRITSDRQLRLMGQIVRQMREAVILTDNDIDSRIRFVNDAFSNLYGYEAEEVLGKSSWILYAGDENGREQISSEREDAVSDHGEYKVEYQDRRKDGSTFWVSTTSSEINLGEDGKKYDLGIMRDISGRVNAEKILREAKDAAEFRASELAAINRMAATVSRSLNLEATLQSVCQELTRIFPIRNAGIALLNEDRKSQKIAAFHSAEADEESVMGMIIPLRETDASWEAMATKKPVVIHDALTDVRVESMWEVYEKRGTRTIMIIPLLARDTAIGTIGMPAKDPNHMFSQGEIELAETIGVQIATAVENARLYSQIEKALDVAERDLEIGRQIQSGFFPEFLPEIPEWEIATHFHPARQVAGDFYDVFQFKNSDLTAFIIADVCDKGVGAALFMVLFRSLIRAFSAIDFDLHRAEEILNGIVLSVNNYIAEIHGRSSMFSTLFFGVVEPDTGSMYYINGGHEPPVILDKDGMITQRLMPTGPVVGLFPDMEFEVKHIQLKKGDILVGFTDGTKDALNNAGESFTEERLLELISAPWTSIFSMIFELDVNLQNFIHGRSQYDDITILAFRRKLVQDVNHHAICRVARMDVLGELRDFAEGAALQTGLTNEEAVAFKLAAGEICNNIIQYGFEGREPGFVVLAFELEGNKATLKIHDNGKFFSPDPAIPPDIDTDWEEREPVGSDIFLVNELMDHVSYHHEEGINVLVLEKILSTESLEVN
jgi:sigma-B regulation protein RsbU (phosphoserine phosphatase)